MTHVEVTVTITKPPAEVFGFLADFANNALWQDGVVRAWQTSEGPLQVGSTITQLSKFMGRDIEFHFEVVAYDFGKRAEFQAVSGTFPVHVTRIVEPIDEGTKVHAIIEGEAGGVFKLAAPLLDRMTQKSIEADYARLKALLESR